MPLSPTRLALVGLAGVLVATGVAVLALRSGSAGSQAADPPPTIAAPAPVAATQLASDGMRASWVVQENQQTGTTAWQITKQPSTGFIAGFADQTYATTGQPVRLFVSTSAQSFHVEAYRIGWYGGTGGRLVWSSPDYLGKVEPPCPLTSGVNMVACDNWTSELSVQIASYFVQGDYLLKLVGSDNEQSYIPLTVWAPGSKAAYVVKNDVFTWQAGNTFGGYDFFQGQGACAANAPTFPPCNRARVVSYDRPYSGGDGAADFLTLEAPLVRYVEQHGLDVTYVNDLLVQQHPDVLTGHSALLSPGHDESWSNAERTAVTDANAKGLNLAFFGASAVLRHVRTQTSPLGADRELVDYRDAASDPVNGKGDPREVTGNTWSSAPADWPETGLVGEAYNGTLAQGVREPLKVVDPSAWIFNGTGLTDDATLPDIVGSNVDSVEADTGHPANVQILAHSALPVAQGEPTAHDGGTFYSDMTYYTSATSQAGVWDSGTSNWIPALGAATGPSGGPATGASGSALPTTQQPIEQMTSNVLWLFGQGPAGRLRPSVANWHSFY